MTINEFIEEMLIPLFILVASLEVVRHQGVFVKAVVLILFGVIYTAWSLYKRRHRWQADKKQ